LCGKTVEAAGILGIAHACIASLASGRGLL
jgi:hypothetical protein